MLMDFNLTQLFKNFFSCDVGVNSHGKKFDYTYEQKQEIVECMDSKPKKLSLFEQNGNHILFTLRSAVSLHEKRLPLLFQTWLFTVNRSNVIIVTDGIDPVLEKRAKEAGIG